MKDFHSLYRYRGKNETKTRRNNAKEIHKKTAQKVFSDCSNNLAVRATFDKEEIATNVTTRGRNHNLFADDSNEINR